MPNNSVLAPADKLHKTYYVIGSIRFKQPGRFRAELEKVKLIPKRKGHE